MWVRPMKFENASKITSIPLDQIKVGRRARQVSEAGVALVMSDVARDGMIRVPISVRRVGTDKYELIDGAHRLEIAKRLGQDCIDARIMLGTKGEADVIEAAANIAVAHMPPLEMAISLAKWNKAYVKLHPSAARGVAGGLARHQQPTEMSFADLLADVMNVTPRHIQRITSVGEKLSDDEMDALRAAPRRVAMDDLYALHKITETDERGSVIRQLSSGAAKSVALARRAYQAEVGGDAAPVPSKKNAALVALLTAWNRAPMAAKKRFLLEKAREIYDAQNKGISLANWADAE
jgi:ParB family transcriptional regulator, chromosome partitioning protein